MAPVVFTVELCVTVAAVTVSDVNAVVAPTAPDNVATPPVPPFKLKVCPPLIVLEKPILAPPALPPAFVVSAVTAAVKDTGPVNVIALPEEVRLPPKVINVGAV